MHQVFDLTIFWREEIFLEDELFRDIDREKYRRIAKFCQNVIMQFL